MRQHDLRLEAPLLSDHHLPLVREILVVVVAVAATGISLLTR